VPMA